MHKTGSTSVQVNLSRERKIENWRYLATGRKANLGNSLFAMLATDPEKFHTFVKQGKSPAEVAREGTWLRGKLAKAIRTCTEENLILSAEVMSIIDKPGIMALRDFLAPLCDEIRVIGYVRPPIGYKTSFFQQRVKHGCAKFDVANIKPRYRKKFKKFDAIFGRENVILRKFDPAIFPNRCVVTDFYEQVGIGAPREGSILRFNESLSREACGILYAYRKFGPGYGVGPRVMWENKRIIAPMFTMGGSKFKVSAEVTAAGLLQDHDDVRWMEQRLQCSLSEDIRYDGTEVAGEDDLLRITRSSCQEYIGRFREMYGIKIPSEMLSSAEVLEPQHVADLVEYSRRRIRGQRAFLPLSRVQGKVWSQPALVKIPKYFRRMLGIGGL